MCYQYITSILLVYNILLVYYQYNTSIQHVNIILCFVCVLSACAARPSNKQEQQNGRNLSFWEAMAPGVPLALLSVCYYVWSVISPNDVIIAQPRVFLFSMGIVFSNIAVSLTFINSTSHGVRCIYAEPKSFLLNMVKLYHLVLGTSKQRGIWSMILSVTRFKQSGLRLMTSTW